MNAPLSLPQFDRDTNMRRVARELAMDIHPLDDILKNCGIPTSEFDKWRSHPNFLRYLAEFQAEWHSATNTHERVKMKAGVVLEEWMEDAYLNLHDKKLPLNHRVELGKLVAKIGGMGEPKFNMQGGGGSGFSLTININNDAKGRVVIGQDKPKVIEHEDDDFDPFTSPNTLED